MPAPPWNASSPSCALTSRQTARSSRRSWRLHVAVSRPRQAAAWLAEKVTELKLRLRRPGQGVPCACSKPLKPSRSGSTGSGRCGGPWPPRPRMPGLQGTDYERLEQRADEQRRRVEAVPRQAALSSFAAPRRVALPGPNDPARLSGRLAWRHVSKNRTGGPVNEGVFDALRRRRPPGRPARVHQQPRRGVQPPARYFEKVRYKWRRHPTIVRFLVLALDRWRQHDAHQPGATAPQPASPPDKPTQGKARPVGCAALVQRVQRGVSTHPSWPSLLAWSRHLNCTPVPSGSRPTSPKHSNEEPDAIDNDPPAVRRRLPATPEPGPRPQRNPTQSATNVSDTERLPSVVGGSALARHRADPRLGRRPDAGPARRRAGLPRPERALLGVRRLGVNTAGAGRRATACAAGDGVKVERAVTINQPPRGAVPLLAQLREPAAVHAPPRVGARSPTATARTGWPKGPLGMTRRVGRRDHQRASPTS